jgi:hypothetical protein
VYDNQAIKLFHGGLDMADYAAPTHGVISRVCRWGTIGAFHQIGAHIIGGFGHAAWSKRPDGSSSPHLGKARSARTRSLRRANSGLRASSRLETPRSRLTGYTSGTVNVRRGPFIYSYDEKGGKLP